MQGVEARPQGLFEKFLTVVSEHERPFLFMPILLFLIVRLSYLLGSFDLRQVLDFLTFHK